MAIIFAFALAFFLGACAAPTASDATDFDRGTLPVGLVHSGLHYTRIMSLKGPEGMDGLSVLFTLSKPVIRADEPASEPGETLDTFADETIEALNKKWEAATPALSKQQVEEFFQDLELPDGVKLEAHVKLEEGGRPKIGLDLVKYDGSTG